MGHRPVYVPFIRRVTLGRVRPDCLSTDSEFLYNFGLVRTNTILYKNSESLQAPQVPWHPAPEGARGGAGGVLASAGAPRGQGPGGPAR